MEIKLNLNEHPAQPVPMNVRVLLLGTTSFVGVWQALTSSDVVVVKAYTEDDTFFDGRPMQQPAEGCIIHIGSEVISYETFMSLRYLWIKEEDLKPEFKKIDSYFS